MTFLILVNSILLAALTFREVQDNPKAMSVLDSVDNIILVIFTVEVVLNWIHLGWKLLKDHWLVFDTVIVTLSWAFLRSNLSMLRSFRIFRIFSHFPVGLPPAALFGNWRSHSQNGVHLAGPHDCPLHFDRPLYVTLPGLAALARLLFTTRLDVRDPLPDHDVGRVVGYCAGSVGTPTRVVCAVCHLCHLFQFLCHQPCGRCHLRDTDRPGQDREGSQEGRAVT